MPLYKFTSESECTFNKYFSLFLNSEVSGKSLFREI